MIKYIGVSVTVLALLGGGIFGYGQLQTRVEDNRERVKSVEEKSEGLKEKVDKTETRQETILYEQRQLQSDVKEGFQKIMEKLYE